MPQDIVGMLMENWMVVIGLATVGLLAYWYFDERNETASAAETVERVGSRAEVVTGGVVGALGSLVVVIASIGLTIGGQLMQTASALNGMLGGAPALVGQIVISLLAWVGLKGTLPLDATAFGWIAIVALLVVLFTKYGRGASG